ncbi:hypothetical protein [Archaeoglobus sp.]
MESINLGVVKEHRLTHKARLFLEEPDVEKARVHNIRVSCKVLMANYEKIIEVGRKIRMKNWDAYIVGLCDLVELKNAPDVKIRFNLAQETTAVIYLPSFYASSKWDAATKIHNMFQQVCGALQLAGVILSNQWIKMKCVYGEYAFETDEPLDPSYEVRLGRNAKDPFDNLLPVEARVWVDESKGKREIETNDADHQHYRLMQPEYVAEIRNDYFAWLKPKVTEIHETVLGLNGFINNFKSILEEQNEFLIKSAELQRVFAENLNSHIPYVRASTEAQKKTTETLEKITQLAELQQRQQQQFLEAMQQLVPQLNGGWKHLLIPFMVILVLLLFVKGVIF